VERQGELDEFFDRLLPRKLDAPLGTDWRARRLKEFVDTYRDRVQWSLDDVCGQLGLALSGRQARRLFVASTGIGIREYAKKRRLAIAAEQLRATNAPVKAVAADA